MRNACLVIGLQWGDEGKGKIVDFLAAKADYVTRFNGGNNAGHTVVTDGNVFKFHHLPSGAVQGKKLLLAQGAVIYPPVLIEEINNLKKAGININLSIDPRIHIVMPYHRLLDAATEVWKGGKATGSLKLGIGYCYEDKNNRAGIRLEDLVRPAILADKVKNIFPLKKRIIENAYSQKVELIEDQIIKEYAAYGKFLKKYLNDVSLIVIDNLGQKRIIFEAAHGTFLDPVFGTYPYTVAPYCISGSVFTGVGFAPTEIEVIGIVKAYTTRVGNGPFPTEQKNKYGETMQQHGQEVGTTSGRKRRCGWLDLPLLRSAIRINGCQQIALTKLDVLSNLPFIKVATHYVFQGKKFAYFPSEMNLLPKLKPVYKTFPGWKSDISQIRQYDKLPSECRMYISYLEETLKVKINLISVGAERTAILKH